MKMALSEKPVVAVDIGGTKITSAVITCEGKMISRTYRLTLAREGPQKVVNHIEKAIDLSLRKAAMELSDIGGVGIAAAAIIDISRGLVTEAPNLPRWRNIPLRERLAESLGKPVFLLNDASAAALGEHRMGAGRGLDNLIYITVSTGIGGGLVINGQLYNGTDGCAAEIGHMIVLIDGPPCKCGQRGCFEAMASGTAIARMARQRLASGAKSCLAELAHGKMEDVTAELVAVAARRKDGLALSVIDEAAGYLGIGLANLVNIINPQMIIIGGGVSKMGAMLLRPAGKSMKEHAFKLPARTVRVVRPGLGMDAGLIGAAIFTQEKLRPTYPAHPQKRHCEEPPQKCHCEERSDEAISSLPCHCEDAAAAAATYPAPGAKG
jgi:glucokinase